MIKMGRLLEIDVIPKSFKLQWHITERCNFRCKHCYQENYDTPEMSLNQMEDILKRYIALLNKWKIPPFYASLSIAGGEPFLYRNFFPFLAKVYKYRLTHWSILSNGSLLNQENVKILKLFKIGHYQVSLEGLEENNDKIRGEGNFKRAINALKLLVKERISATVSLTINKENIKDIFPLAELLSKIGVERFLVRRLVPWGSGFQMVDLLLEPQELTSLYRKIKEYDSYLKRRGLILRLPFSCENAFLEGNPGKRKKPYCAASGGRILVLLPNGDVLPCRRLPIKIGNIFESSFEEIFYCDKMKEIRAIDNTPKFCRDNCPQINNCFGGAKCVTYAFSGRLDIPDVQCPRAYPTFNKNLCLKFLPK